MINLHNEIENEIENSKNQLILLQSQTNEIENKKDNLKRNIEVLEQTNPEVSKIFINELKKGERRSYIVNFGFYVLGVITPFVLTYIITR